tara:strand:+ start:224 stop:931 length:708 start_codon:yes stop_codon:yes gene_type:complete
MNNNKMNNIMNNHIKPMTAAERELIADLFNLDNPVDRWSNLHAWLVVDGEIFDPTPVQEYGEIDALLLGLDLTRPVYVPLRDEARNDKLIELCKMKMRRLDKKFLADCFTNPTAGSCYFNAMVWKAAAPLHHDVKIQFGGMGWERKAGGIPFLQWGDLDAKRWHDDTELLNNNFMKHVKKRTKKLRLLLERSTRTDEEVEFMRDVWHGRVRLNDGTNVKNAVVYKTVYKRHGYYK